MLMWPKARPRAATMSRSRFAVTGLTWVAAHLVMGETTRSRAAPRAISEGIDRHAHRRFERRDARAVDQGDVFIGHRIRFTARIGKGMPRRLDDAQRSIHGGPEEFG